MNEYKGLLIGIFGVFFGSLLVSLEYYKIAPTAGLGALLGFVICVYGSILHTRSMKNRLKSYCNSNQTKESD